MKNLPVSGTLLELLKAEKEGSVQGGIYHKVQIELTYHSNHMEGSRLPTTRPVISMKRTRLVSVKVW